MYLNLIYVIATVAFSNCQSALRTLNISQDTTR